MFQEKNMNRISLFFLSMFLILFGVINISGLRSIEGLEWVLDLRSAIGIIAGLGIILDIYCSCKCTHPDDHSHHHKLILLAFLVLSSSAMAADPLEVEGVRWNAAGAIALTTPTVSPTPSPTPAPTDSTTCGRCNGTGKIKPDGRIEIACPDCGGDGKLTMAKAIKIISQERKGLDELSRKWDELSERIKKDKEKQSPPPAVTPSTAKTPAEITWMGDIDQLRWEVKKQNKYGLIFFTGALNKPDGYCPPCEYAKKTTFLSSEVQNYVNENLLCAKIDAGSLPKSDQDGWGLQWTPSFVLVDPDWRTQLLFDRPKEDDKLYYEPDRFLSLLKHNYKGIVESIRTGSLKAKPVASQRQISYNRTCNCASTGQCTCGPNCQCPDCPRESQIRYAVRHYYPETSYAGF